MSDVSLTSGGRNGFHQFGLKKVLNPFNFLICFATIQPRSKVATDQSIVLFPSLWK